MILDQNTEQLFCTGIAKTLTKKGDIERKAEGCGASIPAGYQGKINNSRQGCRLYFIFYFLRASVSPCLILLFLMSNSRVSRVIWQILEFLLICLYFSAIFLIG